MGKATVLAGIVAGVVATIWVYLVAAHGRFFLTGPRLPVPARSATAAPLPALAIVVPARDEARLLPTTLPTLTGQTYPGPLRVVVVDDCSTDGTAQAAGATDGVQVIRGVPTPAGWAGKVWALRQGADAVDATTAADAADADYLLFTDADIAHPRGSLEALVDLAERQRLDLVSLMARLHCRSLAERLLVPAFVYFFAQLYPFRRVGSVRHRTAAAAGGCLLVRRRALVDAGGLDAIHDTLIDDVAIGRLIKRSGGRLWLGYTTSVRSVRVYPAIRDIWRMVTRSAWVQLRRSWLLLAGAVAGLLLVYAAPVVLTVLAHASARRLAATAWVLMTLSYVPVLRLYGRSPLWALTLPAVSLAYLAMTVHSAVIGGSAWKGRQAAPVMAVGRVTGHAGAASPDRCPPA